MPDAGWSPTDPTSDTIDPGQPEDVQFGTSAVTGIYLEYGDGLTEDTIQVTKPGSTGSARSVLQDVLNANPIGAYTVVISAQTNNATGAPVSFFSITGTAAAGGEQDVTVKVPLTTPPGDYKVIISLTGTGTLLVSPVSVIFHVR